MTNGRLTTLLFIIAVLVVNVVGIVAVLAARSEMPVDYLALGQVESQVISHSYNVNVYKFVDGDTTCYYTSSGGIWCNDDSNTKK